MAAITPGGSGEARILHPGLCAAVLADAICTAAFRGERHEFRSRLDTVVQILRLAVVSDAFLSQALYRLKASLQRRGIPVLPRLLHRLAIATSGIYIGDPVVVHPGVHLAHGQIVIDGIVEVHAGVQIFPFVTIGLRAGNMVGPTIGPRATVGSGAKVLGDVEVGERAKVGANAVVLADVPAGTTVVGVPARAARRTVGTDSAAEIGD